MTAPTRIAILYGAEPYQAYHVADIAAALARNPDVALTSLIVDRAVEPHLDRLEDGMVERPIPRERLRVPAWVGALRALRVFGILKQQVLSNPDNLARLGEFDAIVTPTTHLAELRERIPRSVKLIYCYHGAGARAMSYTAKMGAFDLVLPPGQATVERLVADGLVKPGRAVAIGLVKLDACRRLAAARLPQFDSDRPTVLFNPHSQRALRSWDKFAAPLIEAARGGAFNLIVAPHIKLFSRRPRAAWRRWERLAIPGRIHVDLGSAASLDMSHALAADIYAGDVSSQVYEFLTEPRPCVFLNAHGADWANSRDFPMWQLGKVAVTPEEAIAAIATAAADHPAFVERQRQAVADHLGDTTPGAAGRAAQIILEFLRTSR